MNEPYDYERVDYDSELLTQSGGYLDSSTSHFTMLRLSKLSSS